jgi:hypothetical protein
MQTVNYKTEDLRKFSRFIGVDNCSGLSIYYFDLLRCNDLPYENLIRVCDKIQGSVWNRKKDVWENYIKPGMLFLLYDKNIPVGFYTGWRKVHEQVNVLEIYPGDFMIEKQYHGRDLASLGHLLLNVISLEDHMFVDTAFNLVCSGNISLFKFFEKNNYFFKTCMFKNDYVSYRSQVILKEEFPDSKIDERAVIRFAWKEQDVESQWNTELASKWNFPKDVSYGNGDIFCQIYSIKSINFKELISKLNSRILS